MSKRSVAFSVTAKAKKALQRLLSICLQHSYSVDEDELLSVGSDFANSSKEVRKEIQAFKNRVFKISLPAVIGLWGQEISRDRVLGERYLEMMGIFLESGILDEEIPSKGKITLEDFTTLSPNTIIDSIRCYQEWSLDKREEYVLFFLHFTEWLSKETFGIIPIAEDYDRLITQRRKLSFSEYLEILKNLNLRERTLVKIFYLGGSLELEKVLSVGIKDIDFKKKNIRFDDEFVQFPRHVVEDIKVLLGGRKRGSVFVGKHNERINHTVPYRSLKTVVTKLGLRPDFTFKDFVKNQ